MPKRYWLINPNGSRQLIDPDQFDVKRLAEQARRLGGKLVVENGPVTRLVRTTRPRPEPGPAQNQASAAPAFDLPRSAMEALFRNRLKRIHQCKVDYHLQIHTRPTGRVLGGYYKRRRLVRVYSRDVESGSRPTEELFDTFLHEIAHHLEYTEPETFFAPECGRVPGRMHSPLFWRILAELKKRWARQQWIESALKSAQSRNCADADEAAR